MQDEIWKDVVGNERAEKKYYHYTNRMGIQQKYQQKRYSTEIYRS